MLAILLIFLLIMLNGLFAAAEMAFVTAKPVRLRAEAENGNWRAERVLQVKENSGNFLATVQIGITLVATLASAVGGADVAERIAPLLEPLFGRFADQLALGLIVVLITYASLVIGELVPKRLAIRNAESFAMRVVRPLQWLQRLLSLPIRLLNASTEAFMRLFGKSEPPPEIESTEELTMMVEEAASDGVVDAQEKQLITSVFDYSDTQLRDIMTPLAETVTLEKSAEIGALISTINASGYSRFPVTDGASQTIAGYVHAKDFLGQHENRPIVDFLRPICDLSATLHLPDAYKRLIQAEQHLAIVTQDSGTVDGIVTLEDILEELVGKIEDEYDATDSSAA